jgi:hypothetical protein
MRGVSRTRDGKIIDEPYELSRELEKLVKES